MASIRTVRALARSTPGPEFFGRDILERPCGGGEPEHDHRDDTRGQDRRGHHEHAPEAYGAVGYPYDYRGNDAADPPESEAAPMTVERTAVGYTSGVHA